MANRQIFQLGAGTPLLTDFVSKQILDGSVEAQKVTLQQVKDLLMPYKEYRARLAQSGTSAPSVQKVYVDDITVGTNPNANPNDITLSYVYGAVGNFYLRIRYGSGVTLNPDNFDVSFSDAKIRAASFASGSDGFSAFLTFEFKSYDLTGTIANGVILVSNIYVRRYGI